MGLNRIRMTPALPEYLLAEVHRYGLEPTKRLTEGCPPMMHAAGGWAARTVKTVRVPSHVGRPSATGSPSLLAIPAWPVVDFLPRFP